MADCNKIAEVVVKCLTREKVKKDMFTHLRYGGEAKALCRYPFLLTFKNQVRGISYFFGDYLIFLNNIQQSK
jgi:hypothetical protein